VVTLEVHGTGGGGRARLREFESQGLLDPILDPDDGSGTTVTSWTKPDLRVDLTAGDDLFGRLPD